MLLLLLVVLDWHISPTIVCNRLRLVLRRHMHIRMTVWHLLDIGVALLSLHVLHWHLLYGNMLLTHLLVHIVLLDLRLHHLLRIPVVGQWLMTGCLSDHSLT